MESIYLQSTTTSVCLQTLSFLLPVCVSNLYLLSVTLFLCKCTDLVPSLLAFLVSVVIASSA